MTDTAPSEPAMVTLDGDELVHLDAGTFMWVSIKRFRIAHDPGSDAALLAALIAHPAYHDHYAGQPPRARRRTAPACASGRC